MQQAVRGLWIGQLDGFENDWLQLYCSEGWTFIYYY